VLQKRVLTRIFGSQGESDRRIEKMSKGGFIICTLHHIRGQIKKNEMERA
jgi:hypothetical protein